MAQPTHGNHRHVDPRIMLLQHLGLNSIKEFGGKTSEHNLVNWMKEKFKLIKKL